MNKDIRKLLLAGVAVIVASPSIAADVTAERLTNADKEPHNWLMNHRTYDAQRYSPLEKINKGNIKNISSSPMPSRSAAPRPTKTCRRLRSQRTAISTSSTNGAWSTRSMPAPATWDASCGAWTPARRNCRSRTAAPLSGVIW